jgi:hypothetical protein
MSTRIGRNGDAEVQFTINDAQGEVTSVRLISTSVTVFLKFFDEAGNVIKDITMTAPDDQVIALAPGERPQLVERTFRDQTVLIILYEMTTSQTQLQSAGAERGNPHA